MLHFFIILSQTIHAIFTHEKESLGTTFFCKETDAMATKSDINVAEIIKFKAVIGQKEIDCNYKK